MNKFLSRIIVSNPIGRLFKLGDKQAAWKKVTELKAGQKIAIAANQNIDWDEIVSIKKLGRQQVWDIEVEGTHNFVANGIVAHNTSGLLLRAGASTPTLSSSASSTTADIQLAAADRIDLSAAAFSLSTSNTADGSLKLTAKSNLTLDTSQNNANILLLPGSGNVGIGTTGPLNTFHIKGAADANFGQLRLESTGNDTGISFYTPAVADATNGRNWQIQNNYRQFGDLTILRSTTYNGTPATDVMELDKNGNVGVGTTSPGGILDVLGQCVTGDTRLRRRRRRSLKRTVLSEKGQSFTDDWEDVRIDQIQKDDEILSMEPDGSFSLHKVNVLMKKGYQPTYKLITHSGKQIRTTGEHPYFVLEKRRPEELKKLYATFEVDQSNRLENMGIDSVVALASEEMDQTITVKISKKIKNFIMRKYYSQRRKFFGPEMLATLIIYAIWDLGLKVGKLVIDNEYPNYELHIARFLARYYPEVTVSFKSIGRRVMAHRAAWSRAKAKTQKALRSSALLNTMANLDFKESLAAELLHPGLVTGDSQSTRLLLPIIYQNPLSLSRGEMTDARWVPARYLKKGMWVATVDGWEVITAVYETGVREEMYDVEIEATHNFVGNGIVAHNTSGLLLRAGASTPTLSSGATSTTADIQLAAADRIDLQSSGFRVQTSSDSAGTLALISRGSLILDTSNSLGGTAPIILQGGNVGIGTTGPRGSLAVAGQITIIGQSRSTVTNDTNLIFGDYPSGNFEQLYWQNDISAFRFSDDLIIDGNIGVGTTSPGGILDVLGQCIAKGTRIRVRRRRRLRNRKHTGLTGLLPDDTGWESSVIPSASSSSSVLLNVEDVRPGDEVLTLDEATGEFHWQKVNKLMDKGIKSIVKLTTASGKTIKTTSEHPYLVKQATPFVFIDETGILESDGSSMLGVGALKFTGKMDNINRELREVFLEAINTLPSEEKTFEFKFNYVKPTNLDIYKKLIGILKKYELQWEFSCRIEERSRSSFWKQYLYLLYDVLQNIEGRFTVLADYLNQPGKSSKSIETVKLLPQVVNVLQAESQGSVFLQLVDVLLGATAFNLGRGQNPYRKEIAAEVEKLFKNKKSAGVSQAYAAVKAGMVAHSTSKTSVTLNIEDVKTSRWLKVKDLVPGEEVATVDGFEKIVKIEKMASEQVYDLEVEATHNFVANGIVAHNTSGLLLRAGASTPTLSSSAASTTADIQLAAADRIDLFASSLSLQTSSLTGGEIRLKSAGSITLDTSGAAGGGAPIVMLGGNVGIGTTAPQTKMQVNGDAFFGPYPTVTTATAEIGGGSYAHAGAFSNHQFRLRANNQDWVTIEPSGNVGIGTTSPLYQLQLSTDSAAKPTTNTWTIASDARIKNVVGNFNKGLAEILQVNPIIYTYKENNALGIVDPGEHIGIIAQEVQKVFPEAVSTDPNGYLHFNSDALSWANINAVKELDTKMDGIAGLKNQVSTLTLSTSQTESNLKSLQTRISQLEDLVALLAGGNTLSTSANPSAFGLRPSAFTLSGSYMDSEVSLGTGLVSPQPTAGLTLTGSNELPFSIQNSVFSILSPASVGGTLTVGLITIDDLDASINSIGETLKIQNQALADVEFLGGKIVMTKTGDVEISGNVNVAGDATFRGDVVVGGTVAGSKFEVLADPENPATDSARPTAAAIGEATIPAGQTEIIIYSTAVDADSKVFVTADRPAAVGARVTEAGRFTIELAEPTPTPLTVSWWVVN